MTSRKKIAAITKAAKHQNCAVYIRTGTWRGVMIGESEEEQGLKGWVGDVKVLYFSADLASPWSSPISNSLDMKFGFPTFYTVDHVLSLLLTLH